MNRFETTTIWQKGLAKQLTLDTYARERDLLRTEFENFREKAKVLAADISQTLPEFTIHDITHVDALWETAQLIVGDNIDLTPAEVFVLGGAFLIHDLGMGLASYPMGLDELKKEPIWTDTVTSLLKKRLGTKLSEVDFQTIDKDIEKAATENVLRILHAKHAEKLALASWKDSKYNDVYLLENSELRNAYASIIGLIAHSHWWPINQLEAAFPQILGAPGIFPQSWTVDPLKLACILRIADAVQIDDRRAPSFVYTIKTLSPYSDLHWTFQQKLYQPRLECNRLVYTSKSPFNLDEVDSWWMCYDTLQMIDQELKDVDSLLTNTNRQRFKAIGVASIDDIARLSKLITVDKWQPIDTKIKVTNVAKLVNSLGGKQLYGENNVVPLRELIQNASDAIRARRLLESENEDFGTIIIRFGRDVQGNYIEVEDNGVGMSPKVLTGPFLDFGESFWGTSLMHEELPSLESKGFSSTGKYGVGFFSIFMWANKVLVCSKRFEKGRDDTLVLEFSNGVSMRPLLRNANTDEMLKDGGTKIKAWFSNEEIFDRLFRNTNEGNRSRISHKELIETLCPSIDCNIVLENKNQIQEIIKSNDWMNIAPIKLLKRIIGESSYKKLNKQQRDKFKKLSLNMSSLIEDGKIVGRLFIYRDRDGYKFEREVGLNGIVTIGGLRSSELTGLIGVLIGESDRASRDIGIPIVSSKILKEWATDQADLLFKSDLNTSTKLECSEFVRACKGHTLSLPIAIYQNRALNYEEIKEIIKQAPDRDYIIVHDAAISNYEHDNRCKISMSDNVFSVSMGIPGILQTKQMDRIITWALDMVNDRFDSMSLFGLVEEAFCDVWECSMTDLEKSSKISSDGKSYDAYIGLHNSTEVFLDDVSIFKKPKKKGKK